MNRTKPTTLIASLRIIIPLWLTFILITLCIFFIFVPSLKENTLNQKREMIQSLIDNNWSLLSEYHQMVTTGELTKKIAKSEAIQRIRAMRYGLEGKDYFWINDMHPKMIMHPYLPALEGSDLTNFADPNGKHIFVEFVKTIEEQGAGYVDYMWQHQDDSRKIVPKISYGREFKPWGWILGTGIYLEDLDSEISLIVNGLLKIFSGLMLTIIIISSYITWQTIKIEKRRSRAEKALRVSERDYRAIFENTGTATVIIEDNKIISLANDKFVALSGYPKEEIEGIKKWTEFVLPEDLKQMEEQHILRRINGDKALKTYEFRFVDKDKVIKYILLSVDIIPDTTKSISSLFDITKRKTAEAGLKASHERFLTMLNSIDATVFVADLATHEIIFMNKFMQEGFGGNQKEEKCWKIFRDEESPCSYCNNEKLLDDNNQPTGVHSWQSQNPINKKWYLNYDRAIEWEDGHMVKLQIATDITYLKNMEDELRQAHKMDSIGTLAGGIAHDFNNILFPILGHTEMLLEETSKKDPNRDALKAIHDNALRAKALVKQILTFSRLDVNEFQLIAIPPILKEALKFIRSSIPATINIQQKIKEDCGLVKADPTQIHQIVINLATNAYHAMEKTGGKISVTLNEIEISAGTEQNLTPEVPPGIYAWLKIADQGTGIDKEIFDKIFDPFFTTKKQGKGTGLGLSVVHGIVKSMDGTIQIKNKINQGVEFHIYLPIEQNAYSTQQELQKEVLLPKGNEHVLLVDDEQSIVTMEEKMLEHFGYRVSSHTNSIDALNAFKASPNDFDIVVTDMAMPSMSGEELTGELIKIRSDIPVLLCTGYSEIMSEDKAISLGIHGFLLKPIVMKDLANKIREVLNKKSRFQPEKLG